MEVRLKLVQWRGTVQHTETKGMSVIESIHALITFNVYGVELLDLRSESFAALGNLSTLTKLELVLSNNFDGGDGTSKALKIISTLTTLPGNWVFTKRSGRSGLICI